MQRFNVVAHLHSFNDATDRNSVDVTSTYTGSHVLSMRECGQERFAKVKVYAAIIFRTTPLASTTGPSQPQLPFGELRCLGLPWACWQ